MSEAMTYGTGDPVRLPRRMTKGEEFLHLSDMRRRIDIRLTELAEHFGADLGKAKHLPKSGLRIVSNKNGSLFCKGGPIDG